MARESRLRELLGEGAFAAVLCHGVLMYLEDPQELVAALTRLAAPGGIVSIVTKNAASQAMRAALLGRYADALRAFDTRFDVGGLGVETRGDTVTELAELLGRAIASS